MLPGFSFNVFFFFLENSTEEDKRQLVREIELMKEVGTHRNIVSMLGYWIQSPPIMLIMEYVPNGDLLQWLRNKRQQVSLLYQLYQKKFAGLCFAFCLKNIFSPFAIGLRTDIIHRTQTQTNEFLNFVCLFVIKMSSLSDF